MRPPTAGRAPMRRLSQDATAQEVGWDVFLSYRVDADVELVEKLYDKLTSLEVDHGEGDVRRLTVFWDKASLMPGEGWEQGFARALASSRLVVLVMSRKTFANPPKYDLSTLDEDSKCDNVLLEYELVLELFEMGRVKGVLPLLVGDLKHDPDIGEEVYTHFFRSKCMPELPGVSVTSIQKKALSYLEADEHIADLLSDDVLLVPDVPEGTPSLLAGRTVKETLGAVLSFQGHFMRGPKREAVQHAVTKIYDTAALYAEAHINPDQDF